MNVDPYAILQLPKTFTLEQLRDQYKRLSRQVHPDRGGSKELFQLLNSCYKHLLDVYQGRIEKDYATLKEEFARFQRTEQPSSAPAASYATRTEQPAQPSYADQPPSPPPPPVQREQRASAAGRYEPPPPPIPVDQVRMKPDSKWMKEAPKLTRERFNELFEQHRVETPWDGGYGGQMAANGGTREEISVARTMGKTFDHSAFERATAAAAPPLSRRDLQRYTEPEPAIVTKQLAFTELGIDRVRDYSGTSRETRGGIQYTDYMKAHTTQRLVDPREVKERPQFRSVEDYEAYRAKNAQMSPEEYEEYLVAKTRAEAEEKRRQVRVSQHDQRYQEAYERLQRKMLGN